MAETSASIAETEQDDSKTPTTALDLDALFVRFQRWFKEDKFHCEKWHTLAIDDYRIPALDQWDDTDKTKLAEEGRIPVTMDRTNTVINSVTGSEVANRQEVRYIPRTKGDAKQNEMLTEGARWFRDMCNAEHEESHAFRDTVICGMGWTETRLDYEENPDGDPKIERIDPLTMYWDHVSRKPNLSDARRIWRVFPDLPIEEARAKFPDVDDEDLNAAWAKRSTNESGEPYDASRPRYAYDKPMGDGEVEPETVTLVEVQWVEREPYYRGQVVTPPPPVDPMMAGMPQMSPEDMQMMAGGGMPQMGGGMMPPGMPPMMPPPPAQPTVESVELSEEEHSNMLVRAEMMGLGYTAIKQIRKVHYRAFVGGKVLESGKLFAPPEGSNYPVKGHCRSFAYNCITGTLDRNKGMFFGLVRLMKDPQKFANKFLTQILHILNTMAKGGIVAERGVFDNDKDAEETWARPDAITWAKTGMLQAGKIQPKASTGFPPQMMQMVELFLSGIRDAPGVNAEQLGMRAADQPASLEYQRRQAATTILAPLFDSLKLYRRRQGEVLLYLVINYLADGRLVRITGDNDQTQYVPFEIPDDAAVYDVIVDDAPTAPNQKEQTWQILTQIFPYLKGIPGLPPEVYLTILEQSPLPASAVAEIKAQVEKAQQQAAANPQPTEADMEMQKVQANLQAKQQETQITLNAKKQESDMVLAAKAQEHQLELEHKVRSKHIELAQRPMTIDEQGMPLEQEDPMLPAIESIVQQSAMQTQAIMQGMAGMVQGIQALAQTQAQSQAGVLDGIRALAQMQADSTAQLSAAMTAPKRVVRDPQTQRVIGAETVLN